MTKRFGEILKKAVRRIATEENQSMTFVKGTLSEQLNRASSYIDHLQKGKTPPDDETKVKLAEILYNREGLRNALEVENFLKQADLPNASQEAARITNQRLGELQSEISEAGSSSRLPLAARHFFGREAELRFVFNQLKASPSMGNVVITGRWRSGKTTFLHYLSHITRIQPTDLRPNQKHDWLTNPANYQWIYVDFNNPLMRRRKQLLNHLSKCLPLQNEGDDGYDIDQLYDDIVNNHLKKRTVILIDEIWLGLEAEELDDTFWGIFRALISVEPNLACVGTADEPVRPTRKPLRKESPFLNIFIERTLGPLPANEAVAFITNFAEYVFIEETDINIPVSDFDWILDKSECWPVLLRKICHTRLNHLLYGNADDGWQEEALRGIEPILEAWKNEPPEFRH